MGFGDEELRGNHRHGQHDHAVPAETRGQRQGQHEGADRMLDELGLALKAVDSLFDQ